MEVVQERGRPSLGTRSVDTQALTMLNIVLSAFHSGLYLVLTRPSAALHYH